MADFKSYKDLTIDSDKIIQPTGLDMELKEHQKTVVHAMVDLETKGYINVKDFKLFSQTPQDIMLETRIGILGDKVGSGKSFMIISLLLANKEVSKNPEYYESSRYINIKCLNSAKKYSKTNILIIPHKLTNQWTEFFKHSPKLKIFIYDNKTIDSSSNYDVVVLPCKFMANFNTNHADTCWNRIIVDEADTIKLIKPTNGISISANFIWLVTGTYQGLVYSSKSFINEILKKNKTWIVDYILVKNNNDFIDQSIKLPVPKRISVQCLTPGELRIIKDFIPLNIINMINAGNIDDAKKQLNFNEDTSDNIVKIITKGITHTIKNKEIELEAEKKKKYHKSQEAEHMKKIVHIENIIQRLKDRYDSIIEKISDLENEYCPICLGEVNNPTLIDCCKNVYCFECLTVSMASNNKCPTCRKIVGKKNMHIIAKEKSAEQTKPSMQIKPKLKPKLDVLLEIIKKKPEGKFLVFANYYGTFNKIANVLDENNISHQILTGSSDTITKNINDFSLGKIKILMLNATNFGAGMNLQMATDVIIFHRFNNNIEEQVIGRAQRFGRVDQLNIYYLLYDDENTIVANKDKFEDIDYINYLESQNENCIDKNVMVEAKKSIDKKIIVGVKGKIIHKTTNN